MIDVAFFLVSLNAILNSLKRSFDLASSRRWICRRFRRGTSDDDFDVGMEIICHGTMLASLVRRHLA